MVEARRAGPGEPGGARRLNVGSGPSNLIPGWWNVDIRSFEGIDQVMDVTQPWSWESCLDFVYGEHFIEHLTVTESLQFLVNAGSALVPGGRLRVSTPSLEWVLKTHFRFGPATPVETRSSTWAVNRAFHGWGHKFLYSRDTLAYFILETGFEDLAFFEYGRSETEELRNLERHGGWSIDEGFPSVWIAEARRGARPIELPRTVLEEAGEVYLPFVLSGH